MKPLWIALLALPLLIFPTQGEDLELFARKNLVAWCIVPFDTAKRGPEARSQMLKSLNLTQCAYDWRAEHVPTFEEEIQQYAKHGITFFAFWGVHEDAFALFKKYQLTPQIWQTSPSPEGKDQTSRLENAAKELAPLVTRTRELGFKLGLYNHGGWGGAPENLVAICQHLRKTQQADHVGIVYNFHHAHEHLTQIEESLQLMKPYLHCLNLNGMNDEPNPKILPIGQGKHDDRLLRIVASLGYDGPIGILDHRDDTDAEESLRANLDGLDKWISQQAK
ncbi:MAG: hypothetical protein ACI8T1_000595 [Verrucomicrobiales bacterium]|jgi:hypothetical protein